KSMAIKLPAEVWKTKSGHCFELTLFLVAALRSVGVNAKYCEMFPFKNKGETWDHACVVYKTNGKHVLIDPARRIYDAKYAKADYKVLNDRQMLGNYYVNCAAMSNPWWDKTKIKRLSHKRKLQLSRKAIDYAKLGLKYYPGSKRAKYLMEDNEYALGRIKEGKRLLKESKIIE
ncbi:MAG: transglutaminase-like domain-containing protein, partial [Candidatus Marsarchaeota archaeon]|nr:transglutaminase-like domain-containing protein [Candidatus Marsarchaeota archaeon]